MTNINEIISEARNNTLVDITYFTTLSELDVESIRILNTLIDTPRRSTTTRILHWSRRWFGGKGLRLTLTSPRDYSTVVIITDVMTINKFIRLSIDLILRQVASHVPKRFPTKHVTTISQALAIYDYAEVVRWKPVKPNTIVTVVQNQNATVNTMLRRWFLANTVLEPVLVDTTMDDADTYVTHNVFISHVSDWVISDIARKNGRDNRTVLYYIESAE